LTRSLARIRISPGLSATDGEREPSESFQVGRVLGGRYELLEELGRGAFGLVFRAHDRTADEIVAIKLLRYDHEQAPDAVNRLRSELRMARKVTHPAIVRIYDVIDLGDRLALSMAFVPGETLKTRLLQKGCLGEEALRALALDLSSAIHAAHEAGVVHCDLKPANIMVRSDDGHAVITDFGISRLQPPGGAPAAQTSPGDTGDTATADGAALGTDEVASFEAGHLGRETFGSTRSTGSVSGDPWLPRRLFGTLLYMAPELFQDDAPVAPAIDLYALGVVLYEAATGVPPQKAAELREMVRQRIEEAAPPLSLVRPDLSPELCRVVDGCLERDPAERLTSERVIQILDPRPTGAPRRRAWMLLVSTLVLAGAWLWWWANGLPLGERRVYVEAAWIPQAPWPPSPKGASPPSGIRGPGDIGEGWIAEAAACLARAHLGQRERRFVTVGARDEANVLVHLTLRPRALDPGVVITATVGRPSGRQHLLDSAEGASVSEALPRLLAAVSERIGAGRDRLPPEPAEAADMARLGAASPAAHRLYTEAFDAYYRSTLTDLKAIEQTLRKAIAEDRGWAHPYAALAMVLGRLTPQAREAIRQGRAAADPRRDPLGQALLSSLDLSAAGEQARAQQVLQQTLPQAPDDLLALDLLASSYPAPGHASEEAAVYERLHALRPDLQFGADLAWARERAGRGDEVPALVRAWLERAPESEQAHLAAIALDVAAGRHDAAERRARALLLVHGQAPHRLVTLCDVLLVAGQIREARAVADRLLADGEHGQAFGLYRLGLIAILEGRLGSARDSLAASLVVQRSLGTESELLLTLVALLSLHERVTGGEGQEAEQEELARTLMLFGMPARAAVARYEQALPREAGAACPRPGDFLRELGDEEARAQAAREMLRAAAQVGCAPCAAVLHAGLAPRERSTRSLHRFALCAEAEGQLEQAAQAWRGASQLIAPSLGSTSDFAPDLAVLAHFRLAQVLERLARPREARAEYERFLAFWGHADRPLSEVTQAQAALERIH
jgi:serine/threonine protein kinase/tetratricopeptide (TPR) repeat protein